MGLLDGASIVSSRHDNDSTLYLRPKQHDRGRSRSRSHSRSRSVVETAATGGLLGLVADAATGGSRHRSRSRQRSRSRSKNRGLYGLVRDPKTKRRSSRSRSRSRNRYAYNNRSSPSFFGVPVANNSSRSLFGFGRSSSHNNNNSSSNYRNSTSSYYRRQPRSSFMQRSYRKLKRLLRDLVYYAKRHPMKVFMLAIMPLITGGALTALLARFGMRMPPFIERMLGMGARAMAGEHMSLVGDAVRYATVAGGASAGGAAAGYGASKYGREYGDSRNRGGSAQYGGGPQYGGYNDGYGTRRTGGASLQRGRDGNLQWERRTTSDRDYYGGGGGGGGSSSRYNDGRSNYNSNYNSYNSYGGNSGGGWNPLDSVSRIFRD